MNISKETWEAVALTVKEYVKQKVDISFIGGWLEEQYKIFNRSNTSTDKFEWTDELVAEYGQFFHNGFMDPLKYLSKDMMEEFKKIKKRGRTNWVIFTEDGFGYPIWKIKDWRGDRGSNWDETVKTFEMKTEADQWLIENKPCLSVKDMLELGTEWNPVSVGPYKGNTLGFVSKEKLLELGEKP